MNNHPFPLPYVWHSSLLLGAVLLTPLSVARAQAPVPPSPWPPGDLNAPLPGILPGPLTGRPGAPVLPRADAQVKPPANPAQFGHTPLYFEADQDRHDPRRHFTTRGPGYQMYLLSDEVVFHLSRMAAQQGGLPHSPGLWDTLRAPGTGPQPDARAGASHAPPRLIARAALRMKLDGANANAKVIGVEPQAGTINYYSGSICQDTEQTIFTLGSSPLSCSVRSVSKYTWAGVW